MRTHALPPEDDEDQPLRPSPSVSLFLAMKVFAFGLGGGLFGAIITSACLGNPLLGLILGGLLGMYFGGVSAQSILGRGKRTSEEPLPPLKPGVGLSTHILALREGLARTRGKRVAAIEAHKGRVVAVAISPDGRSLLTGGDDRAVTLWDLPSGFLVAELGVLSGGVRAVSFSPDGRFAAACGQDREAETSYPGQVRVWDVESGRELRRFEAGSNLRSLAFSPDGQALLLGGGGFLRAWDLESAEQVMVLNIGAKLLAENDELRAVAASPNGRYALCGTAASQEARLIDLERGTCDRKYTGHRAFIQVMKPAGVTSVAFSPDGRRVLTGGLDETARVWDTESGKQLACFRGHRCIWGWRGVVGVCFHPDGKRALSASKDGTVRLWDASTGKELHRFNHGARVSSLAVSRDGKLAVSGGGDGVVRVWDVPAA